LIIRGNIKKAKLTMSAVCMRVDKLECKFKKRNKDETFMTIARERAYAKTRREILVKISERMKINAILHAEIKFHMT
jgi:hypothetical protein